MLIFSYKKFLKYNKTTIFFGVFFGLAGIGLLAGSIVLSINTRAFLKTAVTGNGKVIELVERVERRSTNRNGTTYTYSHTYFPRVSFIANDGKEYTFVSSFGSNQPSYSVGEDVKVLYNSQNPNDARIDDFFGIWGGSFMMFIVGILFFGFGGGIDIVLIRKSIVRKWLMENGRPVEAIVQSADVDSHILYQGRSPYRIIAQWIDPSSNSAYIFKSDALWIDPREYVKPGDKIKVIIDPKNPKKYFIDFSFLPTETVIDVW